MAKVNIDLEKLICSLLNYRVGLLDPYNRFEDALKDQGIEYKDGSLHYIGEEEVKKPDTIKFGGEVDAKVEVLKNDQKEQELFEDLHNELKGENNKKELPFLVYKEPDFERMEAEYCVSLVGPNSEFDSMIHFRMCASYRQGLEDMWKHLKGE